jgi:hypothetical protein
VLKENPPDEEATAQKPEEPEPEVRESEVSVETTDNPSAQKPDDQCPKPKDDHHENKNKGRLLVDATVAP